MKADKKKIWCNGQFVEVSEEVYSAYMKGDRKSRYFEKDLKTERFIVCIMGLKPSPSRRSL